MSTASLIVKFSSDGYAENIAKLQQLKSLGFEVQSSLAASAKRSAVDQVNAHVMAYRSHQQMLAKQKQADEAAALERKRLEEDMWRGREQRERELTAVARVQSETRLATMRKEAAEAKVIAKQEADAAKQAAREAKVAPTSASGLNTGAVNVAAYLSIARQAYATFQQLYGVMADITNEAAKWEKFERALTDIEGSASVATRSLDDLYELAKRPGIGLQEANQIYLQFRALGVEGEKAKRMIVDFSNTVALSGGGSVEFERINYQLVQMISKGKVLEEDLRIMRNSMPRLTVLMREAFGATTAKDLRDRGIDAQKFVEGILTQMEKLPTATQTLESRIENAHTAWSRFKASMVNTDVAGKAIDKWTTLLETLTFALEGKAASWKSIVANVFGVETAATARQGMTSEQVRQVQLAEEMAKKEQRLQALRASPGTGIRGFLRLQEAAKLEEEVVSYTQSMGMSKALEEYTNSIRADFAKFNVAAKPPPEETAKEKAAREKAAREAAERRQLEEDATTAIEGHYWGARQAGGGDKYEEEAAAEQRRYVQLLGTYEKKYSTTKQYNALIQAADQEHAATLLRIENESLDARAKADLEAKKNAIDAQILAQEAVVLAAKNRLQGLQDLAEAERGEYAKRFSEIDAWERATIAKMRANEAEKTRIVAAANRKRTETYLSAYSEIAMNTSGFFGSMASMSQQFDAENTRRYAAFVAVQQGLAIASATFNIAVAMSNALKSGFTTLDGLTQMGIVAAEGGKIINSITAMNAAKVGKGAFARGGELGYGEWGIAGEAGAEIIEGPARITSTRGTARALAGGTSLQVNVVNNAGAEVAVQEREDGSFDILLSKAVSAVEQRMTAGVLQGSSKFGKALQTTYQLKRYGT